jgi:hypothetical protein
MKILEVFWEDSWSHGGPVDSRDIDEVTMPMRTVGYFVKETDSLLVIAAEYFPGDGRWKYIQAIDKNVIRKRKVLSR